MMSEWKQIQMIEEQNTFHGILCLQIGDKSEAFSHFQEEWEHFQMQTWKTVVSGATYFNRLSTYEWMSWIAVYDSLIIFDVCTYEVQ